MQTLNFRINVPVLYADRPCHCTGRPTGKNDCRCNGISYCEIRDKLYRTDTIIIQINNRGGRIIAKLKFRKNNPLFIWSIETKTAMIRQLKSRICR
jgi:hypothetical protein